MMDCSAGSTPRCLNMAWSAACMALDATTTRTPQVSSSAMGPRRMREPSHMGPVAVKRPSPSASTL